MKQRLKAMLGLALVGGALTQITLPVLAEQIEWRQVPNTPEILDDSDMMWMIGANTIARNGDAINFDLLEDMHFSYLRIAGNCRTGWMNSIASGYYSRGGIVVERRVQEPLQVEPGKFDFVLRFACRLSE